MEWDLKISRAQMYATKEVLNIMEHYFWNPWFQEGAQHLAVSRCRIWRRCLAEVACIEMIDWFVTNRRDGSSVSANERTDRDRFWPIRGLQQSSRVPLCDAWLEAFNIVTSGSRNRHEPAAINPVKMKLCHLAHCDDILITNLLKLICLFSPGMGTTIGLSSTIDFCNEF